MKLFFAILVFISPVYSMAQANNGFLVYSVQGDVQTTEKGKTNGLKMFDSLNSKQVLVFKPGSKLGYVSLKDKSYHEADKSGTFTIKQLLATEKKEPGTMSKAFGYIVDNFIEKGKMMHGGLSYKSAGVVERGDKNKPLIFPFNKTLLYQTRKFVPVFNDSLAKINPEFTLTVSQEGEVIQKMTLKQGDTLELDKKLSIDEEILIVTRWGEESNGIKVYLADEQQREDLDKELTELDNFIISFPQESQVLSKALFFESRTCFVDAMNYYEKLVQISNGNEEYLQLKNNLIRFYKIKL